MGRGNNGADGRAAARVLTRLGVAVVVLEATDAQVATRLTAAQPDLVIDAAYGTGLSRSYAAAGPGRRARPRRGHPVRTVWPHRDGDR